ncbi:MAG: sulfatase [Phycisphaerales bacterium]|nr:sulfatase [Phycisphaerales bacterium]
MRIRSIAIGLLVFLLGASAHAVQPNIVMFVADDLGWADLGCYGNRFNESPNIDRLAAQGTKFTQFYAAAAVCSPTRASIQSGEYPARFGLTAHIPGHWKPFEKLAEPPCALSLPHDLFTLPQALKEAGYATAHFGKWHLGGKGSGPKDFGYDEAFEFTGHSIPGPRIEPPMKGPKRLAEYIGDRAVSFIEAHREKPFFLHLAHFAVHIPLTTTPELLKKYEAKPKAADYPSQALYAGLLEEMDTSVGRVLDAIKNAGLEENTILIFVSDNGGLEREVGGWPGTSNKPLRNEKGSLYEGGIRVPMIVRWPGVTKAASVCETVAVTTDFYPTLIEAAGVKAKSDYVLDGVSLSPVLRNPSAALNREAIYWHYPHYHHSRPSGAVRAGDFKAIEFFDTGETELYNLNDDLGESKNLAKEMPEKAAELHAKLKAWRHEVNAQMPQANPAYDPKRVDEWWSRGKIEPTEPPGAYKVK